MPGGYYDPEKDKTAGQAVQKKQQQVQQQSSNDDYSSVTTVDQHSGGTLPTHVVTYLAGIPKSQDELARLGMLFGRKWSVDPMYVFGTRNPNHYVSPITGEKLSMAEAQRFTDNYGAVALTAMLAKSLLVTSTTGQDYHRGTMPLNITTSTTQLNAKQVGNFARILSRYGGSDIDLGTGMGLSIQLAKDGQSAKVFQQNIEAVHQWLSQTGQADSRTALRFALQLTYTGVRAKNANDVVDSLFPGARVSKKDIEKAKDVIRQQYGASPDTTVGLGPEYDIQLDVQGAIEADHEGAVYQAVEAADKARKDAQNAGASDEQAQAAWDSALSEGGYPVAMSGEIGPDYWKQVEDEQNRIEMDNQAFSNSAFNKFVLEPAGYVGHLDQVVFKNLMAGGTMVMKYPLAAAAYGEAAIGVPTFQGQGAKDAYDYWIDAGRYATQRLYTQQDTAGSLIAPAVGPGIKAVGPRTIGDNVADFFDDHQQWVSGGIDFGIGWVLDPLVIAGKTRAKYLEGFLVPGTLDHGQLSKKIVYNIPGLGAKIEEADKAALAVKVDKWLGKIDKFASSRISRGLFSSEDDASMLRRVYRLRGKVEARGTLDAEFVKALRDRIIKKFGPDYRTSEEAWNEWQTGMKAHFTHYAPPDSVAAEVVNARDGLGFRSREKAAAFEGEVATPASTAARLEALDQEARFLRARPGDLTTAEVNRLNAIKKEMTAIQDAPTTAHQAVMQDVIDNNGSIPGTVAIPGWLSQEVPGTTILSEYGPRRLVRSAITSDFVTKSTFGKHLAGLPNVNPGRVLNFNGDVAGYVYENNSRWSVFTESELRAQQAEIIHIQNSGGAIESRIAAKVDEWNNEAFDRWIAPFNVDEAVAAKLRGDLLGKTTALNERMSKSVFGVVSSDAQYTKPLLESQLRNQIYVVDPMTVRTGIRHYISLRDRMVQSYRRFVGSDTVLGTETASRFGHVAIVKAMEGTGVAYDSWLRLWKSMVVARPAYFTRVVLGDENLRFLASTSSAGDRILALGFGHRGADNPNIIKRLLDEHFSQEVKVGDTVVTVPRAGAAEYTAAAAGNVRESDLVVEMVKGHNNAYQTYGADGSFGVIKASRTDIGTKSDKGVLSVPEADHAKAWAWDLTKQAKSSEAGVVALESVEAGDDIATTTRKLVDWAKADRYVTLQSRIGRDRAEAEVWADELSGVIHAYTMDSKEIAQMARLGDEKGLIQFLEKNVPVADRPLVHAPTIAELSGGGPVASLTNKAYGLFVQRGEDAWNRQPFFSEMKRRAQTAMLQTMDQMGVDVSLKGGIAPFKVPGRTGTTTADLNLAPSEMLPRTVHGDEGGYVYHISPPENLDSIRTEGLQPHQSFYGIDPKDIPATMQGGRLFFADSLERAQEMSWRAGDNIAFRVKATEVGEVIPEQAFSHSMFGRTGIDPSSVEVLDAAGNWTPLSEAGHIVSPRTLEAVDRAATGFALGQVRRVMFDFTRQSRFSEMLQLVFPFPQPFFEGFQAWGHIAYKNPTAIIHGKQLFELGVNSGFLKKDPNSGEYMVPAAYMYWGMLAGSSVFGSDDTYRTFKQLDSPWMPLANMNMLTASTLKFGAGGFLGDVVGGVPIPVPSLNPVIGESAKWLFSKLGWDKSPLWQGYAMQYGSSGTQLPGTISKLTQIFMPDKWKESNTFKSLQLTVVEAMQRNGWNVDENGNRIPLNEDERQRMQAAIDGGANIIIGGGGKTLEEIAGDQAANLMQWKAGFDLFNPTGARLAFQGQREDYANWQSMLDVHDGDYQGALDEWYATYPNKWMIPIGKTVAGQGYEGPNSGVRVPASELTFQMYRMPGIGDAMQHNPALAALMLVGTDPQIQEQQDFKAFSDILSRGLARYKMPDEYFSSASDAAGWRAYDIWLKTHYYPEKDAITQAHGSESAGEQSDRYLALKESKSKFLDYMYTQNPSWVLAHAEFIPQTQTWKLISGFTEDQRPIDAARGDVRNIIALPGLENFPGIQAMQTYITETDKIRDRMNDLWITDINSEKAKEAGLFDKYNKVVTSIVSEHPDVAPFLQKYFGVRMNDAVTAPGAAVSPRDPGATTPTVLSTNDLVYNVSEREWAFSEVEPSLQNNVINLDERLSRFRRQASTQPFDSVERQEAYAKVDNLINATWRQDPKVMNAWWKAMGPSQQQEFRSYLAVKPGDFFTAFDYSRAGIKLSPYAQKILSTVADSRLQIAQAKQDAIANGNSNFSSGAGYDNIDAYIRQALKARPKDKSLRAALHASNTWGWGIDNVLGYGQATGEDKHGNPTYKSTADQHWAWYLDAVRQTQTALDAGGYGGINYGTTDEKRIYYSVQKWARDLAKFYGSEDEAFKQQWQDLQKLNGGDPIVGTLLLPDDYFGPLGG